MKLHGVQTDRDGEIFQVLRVGMIDEHSDDTHKSRQTFDDPRRARWLDASRTRLHEIEADGIRAQQHRILGVKGILDAADLDARHSRPRRAWAGSAAAIKLSPIRNASAPAWTRASNSARPR